MSLPTFLIGYGVALVLFVVLWSGFWRTVRDKSADLPPHRLTGDRDVPVAHGVTAVGEEYREVA